MPSTAPRSGTLSVLGALVDFDTTSRNSNLPLIAWIEARLTALGAHCERVLDESGTKATLWATFGPENVPGIVLSGHTDTVPVDGQDWNYPPHSMTEEGERLYGRGTSDMKGFLACCVAMAPMIAQAPLKVPIHFAFTYDEEVGCLAVRPLLSYLEARGIRPLACIVGEPTEMRVASGHKSKRNIRVTVTGTPGHSGRAPDFVNAVHFGARLIVKIQNMAKRLADDVQDELYDIPCTTAHVGTAHGGAALNIVPEHFEFLFEFRAIAAHDLDELVAEVEDYARDPLLPEMRAIDTRADIQFEVHADSPGMDIAVDHPLTRAVQRYAQRNDLTKIIYGTEGGIFQKIGRIPTIICGPGTIDVAHKPDEFIEKGQLAQCEAFLERLILDCRSGQLDIQL